MMMEDSSALIEESEIQFSDCSDTEKAYVLHDIIEELAIETQLPVSYILQMVANNYGMKLRKLKKLLLLIQSCFVQNNNVVLYVKGEPIFRTNANSIMWKGLCKLKTAFKDEEEVNVRVVRNMINEFFVENENVGDA